MHVSVADNDIAAVSKRSCIKVRCFNMLFLVQAKKFKKQSCAQVVKVLSILNFRIQTESKVFGHYKTLRSIRASSCDNPQYYPSDCPSWQQNGSSISPRQSQEYLSINYLRLSSKINLFWKIIKMVYFLCLCNLSTVLKIISSGYCCLRFYWIYLRWIMEI